MTIKITHVVAVALNGVIGADGAMPWRLPSDLKRFKQITMGKPIIMGRKTFESIGRPLPGRPNIVISRSLADIPEGVSLFSNIDDALDYAQHLASEIGVDEVCVIGGGEIYRQTLERVDRIYMTRVNAEANGDTTYPKLVYDEWEEVAHEHHSEGPNDTADFDIVTLERVRK
ncbi:MAG: dihydrofolate reductase [Hyphomicrobiales bacterium]